MPVINRVRDFRKSLQMTQEELGKRVGVSRQTIISLEKGSYVPSLELALDIAKVFELKVEDIFEKQVEDE